MRVAAVVPMTAPVDGRQADQQVGLLAILLCQHYGSVSTRREPASSGASSIPKHPHPGE